MQALSIQATQQSTFDASHSGPVHDAQLDYYGKLLASASSDHSIHLWDLTSSSTNEPPKFLTALRGHDGPVWQVSWAHPKFGNLLASCSYDRKVIIWRAQQLTVWTPIYISEEHATSVDAVEFAPWEFGLHLACGSSDGSVSIISYNTETGTWSREAFHAHPNGVSCLSWAPANPAAAATGSASANSSSGSASASAAAAPQAVAAVKRLVTGGADQQVRVWNFVDATNKWSLSHQMGDRSGSSHSRWVRDVAWRPGSAPASNLIASCADDCSVILWQEMDNHTWKDKQIITMNGPVWKVSWSATGAVLSAASGTNSVSLFKENLQGVWEHLSDLTDLNPSLAPNEADNREDLMNGQQQQQFAAGVDSIAQFDDLAKQQQQQYNAQPAAAMMGGDFGGGFGTQAAPAYNQAAPQQQQQQPAWAAQQQQQQQQPAFSQHRPAFAPPPQQQQQPGSLMPEASLGYRGQLPHQQQQQPRLSPQQQQQHGGPPPPSQQHYYQ